MSEPQNKQEVMDVLKAVSDVHYGDAYRDHFLTMYRDYVASADAISNRRNTANSFFLTINTGFVGALGYFEASSPPLILIQAVVGMLFCIVWWRMIQSYRTLNGSKFKVIQLMERSLPLAPFTAEEMVQDTGPVVHRGLTVIESYVPFIFLVLHFGVAAWHVGQVAGS